jgi:hypothetical protein
MLVPFTSINFSNVKAQEYGTYDDEYDDDMYSTYPTEVNKYECQKGPFEGDLVESVEFCFKKAHDRDDKQGDGEEGEPGPTGLFQINASNYYKQTNWTYCYHRSFSWPAGCSFYGFVSYGRCRNKW